jgi:hypothetical protein
MGSFLSLLIVALLQVPATGSGFRIAGRVLDGETGKPIPDASVVLSSANADGFTRTVTVGADGLFQFVNIPRGSYQLRTQHPKPVVPYRSDSLDIDLKNDLEGLGMILSPAVPKSPIQGKVTMTGSAPLPRASSILFSGEAVSIRPDGTFETRLRAGQPYVIEFRPEAEGLYLASVSGGEWNEFRGIWKFREGSVPTLEIVVGVGRGRVVGRVLGMSGNPSTSAIVTITGPAPLTQSRTVTITSAGTFTVTGIRAGTYVLRAISGSGETAQAALREFSVTAQGLTDLDVRTKPATLIRGQVILSPPHTIADLLRFDPSVLVDDAMGTRFISIDSKGMFQFKSFESDFRVAIPNLPIEFHVISTSKGPGTVEILLGATHNDRPDRLLDGKQPLR